MLVKSYEIKNNKNLSKCNFFLMYGENIGLKKDIKDIIPNLIKKEDDKIEFLSIYENEILSDPESFYNFIYSGSLFGNTKIITIYETSEKILGEIKDIYNKYPENIFLLFFAGVLEKKSKLRTFFELEKNTVCIPCYLDSEKDLEIIARSEFKKNKMSISREAMNLLIEKANSDRDNLRNEIEKIKSYSLNKKSLELDVIKSLINFSGEHKSDVLVNECLCGNISQFKKIISELYTQTVNQIFLLRILNNKVQRLLKIKEQENKSNNIDNLISIARPPIFWKDKPIVKKQLSIWSLDELKKMVNGINDAELLCKKNPQISKIIFFDFFSQICVKANNFS